MKAGVVHLDEHEGGLRMILNFGHTIGHALEQATGYKVLLHGEAVGWGMIAALDLALSRGTISGAQHERLERLIQMYGPLPALKLRPARVVEATGHDKKSIGGVLRFILPIGIGSSGIVEDVTPAELEDVTKSMLARVQQA
jgi:3-dehydroquinate synthase